MILIWIILVIIVIILIYFFFKSSYKYNKWEILTNKITSQLGYDINIVVIESKSTYSDYDKAEIHINTENDTNQIVKELLYQLSIIIHKKKKENLLSINEKLNLYMMKKGNFDPFK